MLGDISKADAIYIAVGYTDMRKSIDGLSAIVQQNFKMDPCSNNLYIFQYMPGVRFEEEPEWLEDFLPWNPDVQTFCKSQASK